MLSTMFLSMWFLDSHRLCHWTILCNLCKYLLCKSLLLSVVVFNTRYKLRWLHQRNEWGARPTPNVVTLCSRRVKRCGSQLPTCHWRLEVGSWQINGRAPSSSTFLCHHKLTDWSFRHIGECTTSSMPHNSSLYTEKLVPLNLCSLRTTLKSSRLNEFWAWDSSHGRKGNFWFDGKGLAVLRIVGSLRAIWEIARH